MTTQSTHDLAHSRGVPEPVRQAMLAMQERITALEADRKMLRKALEDLLNNPYREGTESSKRLEDAARAALENTP